MLSQSHRRCRHGQWTLIGTLVALAILITLVAIYVPRIAARHSEKGGPPTPIERAYGAGCTEYVGQINQAISMYKDDHDGAAPDSLDDLKHYGIGDEILHADGCSFALQNGAAVETAHGTAPAYQPPQTTQPGAMPGAQPAPQAAPPPGGGSTVYGVHIPGSVLSGGSDASGGAGGN